MDILLEPWRKPPPEAQLIVNPLALERGADQILAARVLTTIARNNRMSLLGKMQHLTEAASQFNSETEAVLDGIAAKIATGKQKRDAAAAKHHGYYDAIIAGVDQSTEIIDRLSNGPLSGAGDK